jgi:ABC-type phosphonate transport system ATPase subunit
VRRSQQARDALVGDDQGRDQEQDSLAERRQVLGARVAERMLAVGRLGCGPDREEGEDRGHQVQARVDRVADEAEAAGQQAGQELAGDDQAVDEQ